jgi:glutamate formiminotransferase/formiminotetrahydrofolate cyclodeaminase
VLHDAVQRLIPMIDADTAAFSDYMDGVRMPQETASEKAARHAKMQAGLKTAVAVPLQTMQLGDSVWAPLCDVARHGNPASRSDVEVGAKALETGIWGAYRNVLINLEDIEDAAFKQSMTEAAEQLVQRAAEKCAEVLDLLAKA